MTNDIIKVFNEGKSSDWTLEDVKGGNTCICNCIENCLQNCTGNCNANCVGNCIENCDENCVGDCGGNCLGFHWQITPCTAFI